MYKAEGGGELSCAKGGGRAVLHKAEGGGESFLVQGGGVELSSTTRNTRGPASTTIFYY